VICLQNGIDNDLTIKNLASNLNVHPGWYMSAQKIPGSFLNQDRKDFDLWPSRQKTRSKIYRDQCSSTFWNHFSPNIEKDLWQKLFCRSFAAVTVRFKTSIGPALADPIMRNYYLQSLSEVIAVAKAEGISLDPDILKKSIARAEKFPPETKSSLLVDLENHRQTEIETLHGTVVRLAKSMVFQ
jgi:2-dehydropantoate 2-reductase